MRYFICSFEFYNSTSLFSFWWLIVEAKFSIIVGTFFKTGSSSIGLIADYCLGVLCWFNLLTFIAVCWFFTSGFYWPFIEGVLTSLTSYSLLVNGDFDKSLLVNGDFGIDISTPVLVGVNCGVKLLTFEVFRLLWTSRFLNVNDLNRFS